MYGAELQQKVRDNPEHTDVYFCRVCDRKTWWWKGFDADRHCLECEDCRVPCHQLDCEHSECNVIRNVRQRIADENTRFYRRLRVVLPAFAVLVYLLLLLSNMPK